MKTLDEVVTRGNVSLHFPRARVGSVEFGAAATSNIGRIKIQVNNGVKIHCSTEPMTNTDLLGTDAFYIHFQFTYFLIILSLGIVSKAII